MAHSDQPWLSAAVRAGKGRGQSKCCAKGCLCTKTCSVFGVNSKEVVATGLWRRCRGCEASAIWTSQHSRQSSYFNSSLAPRAARISWVETSPASPRRTRAPPGLPLCPCLRAGWLLLASGTGPLRRHQRERQCSVCALAPRCSSTASSRAARLPTPRWHRRGWVRPGRSAPAVLVAEAASARLHPEASKQICHRHLLHLGRTAA
mmetsp:Transcript_132678/g.330957  ORF Transcript_132678/g.330957 Transcript_132678/m.330957 type:complete len:205 (+) Transcript_132678:1404-2018(+)